VTKSWRGQGGQQNQTTEPSLWDDQLRPRLVRSVLWAFGLRNSLDQPPLCSDEQQHDHQGDQDSGRTYGCAQQGDPGSPGMSGHQTSEADSVSG